MNNKYTIKINSFHLLKRLNDICNKYEEDINIGSGIHIVDAKSMIAILAFDLTRPLNIEIITSDEETIRNFYDDIESFIVRK